MTSSKPAELESFLKAEIERVKVAKRTWGAGSSLVELEHEQEVLESKLRTIASKPDDREMD